MDRRVLAPASVLTAAAAPDRVEALLRQLVEGQQRIIDLLERHQRPSRLTRADREALARVLPAVAGALGSELFVCSELITHEAAGVRLVVRGLTARQLGRLLQRADGVSIGGHLVQRQGVECGAVLWRIVATVA